MTNEEAIEHAKALKDFCLNSVENCKVCPFSKKSTISSLSDVYFCKLVDLGDPPLEWELEQEE